MQFRKLTSFIMAISVCLVAKAQINNYKGLLDSATKFSGLFIGTQPFRIYHLDLFDTTECKRYLEETANYKINPHLLIELIIKSHEPDTSLWSDVEFDKFILIDSNKGYVYIKDVVRKLNLTDKKQIRFYRKRINKFNNTSAWDKEIFYFSRPVFDSSGEFALIGFDNGHGGFGGGGAVTLFQFSHGTWKAVGNIKLWRH